VRLLPCLLALALLPFRAGGTENPELEGVAAYYRGDLESCLRAYREVLRRNPWDIPARRNLVRVLRESGRPRDALGHLELLLCLRSGDPALRLAAAETALFAGQADSALGYLRGLESSPEEASLRALALMDLGRKAEAATALAESLEAQSNQPLAWYWLGLLRGEQGELDQAEAAFRQALAQEPNLTGSHLPLARVYLGQGKIEQAFRLLQRAEAGQPKSRPIRELLQELSAQHPALLEEAQEESRMRREAAAPRKAEALPDSAASLPLIRIGLSEKVRELHLKTGGAFFLGPAGGSAEEAAAGTAAASVSGPPELVLSARMEGGETVVFDPEGNVLLRSASPLRLAYDDPADTTILFEVQFGQGSFWAGSEDRMYRGALELLPRPEGLTVVNILSIEEYLYSVLPSEMPAHWPQAALQAQAVAARSYTLANLGGFAARGFDLLGSVFSAAYRGMGAESPSVRQAVEATRGLVLMEGGKPLPAYYSANSGGHTDTTETAWGFPSSLPAAPDPLQAARPDPLPPEELALWLAARPESYSSHPDYSSRSAYRWKLWVSREQIEARLEKGAPLGSIRAILPAGRGPSGRVREVRIRGTSGEHFLRWDAIRWGLGGLRSNLFTVEPKLGADGLPQYFVFTGAGWGHGVGLCQSGAAGMAAAGWSVEQILRHYYGQAALDKRY
jgi:SpoIID/LytB domain protein